MCTVTLVPAPDGVRLACNRDERRERAAALPPATHRLGDRIAVFPVDPVGGGTWIGINDAGLAVALLNRTPAEPVHPAPRPRRSRGLIVPHLLECASTAEAVARAHAIDPQDHELFRLVIVSAADGWLVTSDGVGAWCERLDVSHPVIVTSSSLGDHLVYPPRARLFHAFLRAQREDRVAAQERVHDHQWPSHPEMSVRMARADARTVSRTFVTLVPGRARMTYEDLPESAAPHAALLKTA